MTQREKYSLEFIIVHSAFYDRTIRIAKAVALKDSNKLLIGGIQSYFIESMLNLLKKQTYIDDMIAEVTMDIQHGTNFNDSYGFDDTIYSASYQGNLVIGHGHSHIDPANCKIPLTDFRDLLLEWRDFLKQNGISRS